MVELTPEQIKLIQQYTGLSEAEITSFAATITTNEFLFPCMRALIAVVPRTKLHALICCIHKRRK